MTIGKNYARSKNPKWKKFMNNFFPSTRLVSQLNHTAFNPARMNRNVYAGLLTEIRGREFNRNQMRGTTNKAHRDFLKFLTNLRNYVNRTTTARPSPPRRPLPPRRNEGGPGPRSELQRERLNIISKRKNSSMTNVLSGTFRNKENENRLLNIEQRIKNLSDVKKSNNNK
jgi:hypothetical protein